MYLRKIKDIKIRLNLVLTRCHKMGETTQNSINNSICASFCKNFDMPVVVLSWKNSATGLCGQIASYPNQKITEKRRILNKKRNFLTCHFPSLIRIANKMASYYCLCTHWTALLFGQFPIRRLTKSLEYFACFISIFLSITWVHFKEAIKDQLLVSGLVATC